MFNLQGSELIIILLLALVVLGPEKLPEAMRKAGQAYAELKKMSSGFQQEFRAVIDEPMKEVRETANLLRDSADFTKLQTGERDEKPKSAEMVAAPDPDAVPVDDVPTFDTTDTETTDTAGADTAGADTAEPAVSEDGPAEGQREPGLRESEPDTRSPDPFANATRFSAATPAAPPPDEMGEPARAADTSGDDSDGDSGAGGDEESSG